MKNLPLLIGTLVVSVVLIVGIAFLFSNQANPTSGSEVDQNALLENYSISLGPTDAPVTIVEFTDFECPACKVSQPMATAVRTQFPEQVRLVYRNFPLDQIHPYARLAAQAAQVAHTEGKFAEFSSVLFEKQETWSSLESVDLLKDTLSEYASELGIDSASFLERMDSQDVVAAVQRDVEVGKKLNIMATPTFFVNGKQTPAPELLDAVKQVLDQQ